MRILLDTQPWLWTQASSERFNADSLDLVEQPDTELVLSAASSWEIAIKYALGKLPLHASPGDYVPQRIRSSGGVALPVTHTHALRVAMLPPHHRDLFDRLLVAQAQVENLTILTSNRVCRTTCRSAGRPEAV
ncbi:MAG: type II toxin-antitoxin system VapC family toxin [Egibacteraceae bacterium]